MPEIQMVFGDIEDIQELVDESITQGARLGKIGAYIKWCHAGKPLAEAA